MVAVHWTILLLTTAASIGIPLPLPDRLHRPDALTGWLAYPWAVGAAALAVALVLLSLPPRRANTPIDIEDVLVRRHDRLRFTSWLLIQMGTAGLALAVVNLFRVALPIPNWAIWLVGAGLLVLGSVFGNRALDLTPPGGRLRHYRNRLAPGRAPTRSGRGRGRACGLAGPTDGAPSRPNPHEPEEPMPV